MTHAPTPTPVATPKSPSATSGSQSGGVSKAAPTGRAATPTDDLDSIGAAAGPVGGADGSDGNDAAPADQVAAGGPATQAELTAYELTRSGRSSSPTVVAGGLYRGPAVPTQQLLLQLLPTIATAVAGGAAWAAFAMFGKRRRDDDRESAGPDDKLVAAAAAAGFDGDAGHGLEPVDESLLPRWRRPSLQQVRRADPLRAGESAPHLSFESAGIEPLGDFERRVIAYRLVRLLDSPDELRSREIGILDQGDEVQLLERSGAYWLVLCPDGRQGWIHRMTLADPHAPQVQAQPDVEPAYVEASETSEVEYPEESGSDGLLEAYMTARRDVLKTLAGNPTLPEPTADTMGHAAFQGSTFTVPVERGVAEPEPELGPEPMAVVAALAPEPVAPPTRQAPAEPISNAPTSAELVSPVAESERAGEKYSARRNAGNRKASTSSRPGTRSRRPSR